MNLRLVLAAFALTASLLQAQSTTQSIQGLVTDSTGAVVSGAKVTITNTATGVTRSVTTNDAGLYSFPLVEVGNFDLRCEMQGFKSEFVRGIRVDTAAQVRHEFQLQVGNVAETIEVSAAAVTLETENSTVGGVIENKRIIELPLNGRNVAQLAVLVPGVQFGERTGRGDGLGGFPIPGQGFSVSANGQREIHQVVSLDGVDAKDPRIHITNFVPSVEAIEEFKIQTSAYTAEYGFGGGAQVTITMKSGTNSLHGTLFEFLRNDKFDAEHYFLNFERPANLARNPKDKLRQNQFGLVVSGPLIRNKTFWAFNWESRRVRRELVQEAFFPHDNFRNGDFSELLRGTVNPATGRLFRPPIVIYDPFTGEPFANNVIPAARIHPGMKNVMEKYLPRAEFRGVDPLDITVRKGVGQPIDANQYFGRVDHYFSDKDRVFGRIAIDRSRFDNNNINPNFPVNTPSAVANLATQWIHTFNQNMINELRVGFNISDDTLLGISNTTENFDMDALGIGEFRVVADGNRKLTKREQGVPLMGFTIGERINGNGLDRMDTIQIGDHLSLIKGKHNLKFGGEIYKVSMERAGANLGQGRISFGGAETGYNFASFLLGLPSATETPEGEPATFPRATRWGAYIHDDWKATPRLTVNIGLRFDFNGVPIDAKGLWRSVDFPGEGTEVGRGKGYRTPDGRTIPAMVPESVDEKGAIPLWKRDIKFFMPRVGLAYRPSDKWVFRLGAGWFDNINHMNTWTILNLQPPKSSSLLYQSVTDAVATRVPVTGTDGQPYMVQTFRYRTGQPILTMNDPFLTRASATAVARPVALLHIKPDTKDGDVWKWSFDIQRELPLQTALTVGYVGTKGAHVGNSIGNYNDAPVSTDRNVQARRRFQNFFDPALPQLGVQTMSTIRYLDSYGESFYHGLQVKADKRFARGLAMGIAYTFSKAHGDGENGGQEGVSFQDARDRKGSRGRFRFDQTHNFVGHFVYELPGRNLPGALKYAAGGWQANGIVSLRSGFPFTVTQGGDLNTGGPVRPDRLADGAIENPTRAKWFDPLAFRRVTCNIPSRPDLCHFGSSGYNILDGPSQHNFDLSLFKNIPIMERYNVQFRAEFFNAFNTPYFGGPNGIGFATNDSIVPDGARMGEIRGLTNPMRIIQFGLKLSF
ncbi:MAG: TonB-dependent receptor domain-containing protein [Bryobacteraceae bacterium]